MVDMFVYYFTKYGIPIFLMVGMIWFMTSILPDMLDNTLEIVENEEQETQDVQTNTTEQETNETVNGTGTIEDKQLESIFDTVYTFLPLFILAPIIMLVLNLLGTSGGSRHERAMSRSGRDLERELRRTEARLRVSLREYEEKQREQRKPSPSKVFSCTHGPDDTVREFLPGDGLFEISVTKFDVPSYTQQISNIREMPEVVLFNSEDKTVKLDLGEKYGKYDVEIARTPSAERTDGRHKCDDNPFIHPVDHEICLGNARSLYDTTYKKGHYQECLKIIIKVLTCDDASGGFKKSWRECR